MYQLKVIANITSSLWTEPNREPGDLVWVSSREGVRHLIESGLCEWLPAGPTEVQAVPQGLETKKLSGDLMDGPSTGSLSSSEPGQEKLQLASEEGPA